MFCHVGVECRRCFVAWDRAMVREPAAGEADRFAVTRSGDGAFIGRSSDSGGFAAVMDL